MRTVFGCRIANLAGRVRQLHWKSQHPYDAATCMINIDHHLLREHLWIGERLAHVLNDPAGDTRRIESLNPALTVIRREPCFDKRIDLATMRHPLRVGCKARFIKDSLDTQRRKKAAQDDLRARRNRDVTVSGGSMRTTVSAVRFTSSPPFRAASTTGAASTVSCSPRIKPAPRTDATTR